MVRRDLVENGTVTKVSDLKGRKIMTSGDQAYRISRILKSGNLTPDDVTMVSMDFPSGVLALRNGAVDAADLTEPYVTQALDGKVAVMLFPTETFTPDYPTPLFYGSTFLDKDPELGRRFMVAYLQGVRKYNEGKTERNLAILGNYTHFDRELLNQSCWLPINQTGDPAKKPVRDYLDWLYANKQITQAPDDGQLFDLSYVTYANGVLANTPSNG
jgi:NitT/TauT family transport system substrate-binding protein